MLTTVRDLRTESPNAATVRLDLGSEAFAYRPGQYITIDPHQFEDLAGEIRERETQRGKPLGPGYFSLSSDGLDPSLLEFTVKLPTEGQPATRSIGVDAVSTESSCSPGGTSTASRPSAPNARDATGAPSSRATSDG